MQIFRFLALFGVGALKNRPGGAVFIKRNSFEYYPFVY
jgi:hypothetical protein